ncbi:MBL fold metallo-hydrolase [Tsukamurella paurometabola]|uniref:Beta-lactamase domain protein n=1 Tax=Tsukamurella paurometabola (strain ATCC 8368 / DSM 20162 / CCUG 35730 / CIP 100753 / JCM 10117 / KCTC 9821 / NBRC 16120 / NCIMB 702349 / NCTC 13040) TaxID=521096 RepID=D5UXS2_TSUPD|nr:MBL fold metallo-hydrolase [Tsukamurella paurometabola]ADG80159.1 beta-lactamase domain protein [Tsukamurella paurometabola DSM 20162]SUP38649.1 Beta-lactamase superfamily domain [Tsukamurella paurometabola]
MRLKPGRPRLADHRRYFDEPPATPSAPVTVTWAGVTTLAFSDGDSAVMTDGFFTRPSLVAVGLGRLSPSRRRIDAALSRLSIDELDAVVPVHTHFDHAMDSAVVAERTGAVLVGGASVAHLGHTLPDGRVHVVTDAQAHPFGAFDVTLIPGRHCPPDRYPGAITAPVIPPVRASAYRCGEAWSMLVCHRPTGRTALVVGSAGFVPGALAGRTADVVYLGVGQLGLQSPEYMRQYWAETVRTVGARRVVLTHWDDFFRPLDHELRALPYAGDDLNATMAVLTGVAADDGVALHFPEPFQPTDPWRPV